MAWLSSLTSFLCLTSAPALSPSPRPLGNVFGQRHVTRPKFTRCTFCAVNTVVQRISVWLTHIA
jgi:hypothetical protein